ncbi:MAG: hypothetical protein HQ536_03940, partial [Parcubacteria group bacterium]|nr:hypothetical protein [Parcubacteria group bacterium]
MKTSSKNTIIWHHVATRLIGLFETHMANGPYSGFPVINGGFKLDTVILGKNGTIKRYVNRDQLTEFERIIKKKNFVPLLKKFEDYQKTVMYIFKKNPIESIDEFMNIFKQLWIHEITSFFIGTFSEDKKTLEIASRLRGTKNAQHIAVAEFLPKLFNQISKKTGIDKNLLEYLLPEELEPMDINEKRLKDRKRGYVIEKINGRVKVLTGKKSKDYIKKFSKHIEKIEISKKDLKGNCAFPGIIKGKVALVKSNQDLKKVKKGYILVSPMTRSSFTTAMKNAAAIITDEGGITCHA